MSLEEHIKRSREIYEIKQSQLEERKQQSILTERKNESTKKARKAELAYNISRLEDKEYKLFKGDQTRFLSRLLGVSFIARVGDFKCFEDSGGPCNPNSYIGGGWTTLSYKEIKSNHNCWSLYEDWEYFGDWDLTLSKELIEDVKKLEDLKREYRVLSS